MAARAAILHDFGGNAPSNWEYPFGSSDMHVALAIYSDNEQHLGEVLERARQSRHDLAHVSVVYRMRFNELPGGRNPFGFRDGLHNPHVEGSVAEENAFVHAASNPSIKAGEFVMGYPDELGQTAQAPIPDELRHNGTFVAFRKFHMDVAAFRKYLRAQASSPEEEELLAAKMVGRWRGGAPLVLTPDRDDPTLGGDPNRNNDFSYADDMKGLKCRRPQSESAPRLAVIARTLQDKIAPRPVQPVEHLQPIVFRNAFQRGGPRFEYLDTTGWTVVAALARTVHARRPWRANAADEDEACVGCLGPLDARSAARIRLDEPWCQSMTKEHRRARLLR